MFVETEDERGGIGIGTAFHVGEGVFLTAAHVVRHRKILTIGRDDGATIAAQDASRTSLQLVDGPFFHADERIDVACFRAQPALDTEISLGGHLDDWLPVDGFVMHRTVIMGYPPIPLSNRPCLFAQSGEINTLIDKYAGTRHPLFIISTMARGGFSGAPVLLAYNENKGAEGTAALGMVTETLCANSSAVETGYLAVLTVEPLYDCLEQAKLLPKSQRLLEDEHPQA